MAMDRLTWNQKIRSAMIPGWEYRACDLTKIYFDAGRRLRGMASKGTLTRERRGKYVYYKLKENYV